ncbi:mobile mystery protein B [Bacteroidota bacterium]
MGLNLEYIYGQTPLDDDEKQGLKIRTISTRGDLNEFEQLNIEKAIEWIMTKDFSMDYILSEVFIKELHKRMFADVWDWAGAFRKTNKNLGVDKHNIAIELRQLLDDCLYWIENDIYSEDEITIRFKHRIVNIHPFPNGNGRHSRLMSDIISEKIFQKTAFSWGVEEISKPGETRKIYIKALQVADLGDYLPLISFARS